MKNIRVLRDYSGEEGHAPDRNVAAGSKHEVSDLRAKALEANGLVEIIGEVKVDEPPVDKTEPAPINKSEPAPANKAAPKRATKR